MVINCLTKKMNEKMKKVVRMLGLCALVALAFTSCKKNDNTNKVTFKAVITQPVSDDRIQIDNLKYLNWNEGDVIRVFNIVENVNESFTVESGKYSGMDAQFDGDPTFLANIMTAGTYTAFYPVYNVEGDNVILNEISTTQNWVHKNQGGIENGRYPLYAVNNDEGNFVFNSDAGILRINLTANTQGASYEVEKIEISAPENEWLAGTLSYNKETCEPSFTHAENGNKITLMCNNVTVTDDTKSFDIIVRGGTLENGFSMKVWVDGQARYISTDRKNKVVAGHIRNMDQIDATTLPVVN